MICEVGSFAVDCCHPRVKSSSRFDMKKASKCSAFNSEQLEQLYKMFSSFQTTNPSGSLAHKGNFFRALNTTALAKVPWIIDSGVSNHMTDSYDLFVKYSSCAVNRKIKLADGSLSPVARK